MKMKAVLPLLALALGLTGCSGLSLKSSAPPQTLYTLHAAAASPQAGPPLRIVAIATPVVPPGFDAERIAVYLDQGRRMDYAAGAAWPGPFPRVLQEFLAQSAATVPGMLGVTPDSGIPASQALLVRVNDFEPIYSADAKSPPLLKESITFTLVSVDKNKTGAIFTLTGEMPASSNTLTAITQGLEVLARNMAAEVFRKIGPAPRARPPNAHRRK